MRPELMNSLALAYIGDAVFEVLVRDYLVCELGITKVNDLQKTSVGYVSAVAQASFMKKASEQGLLSEEEIRIYKRGRNTKGRRTKHVLTHNQSTGFEAIIGTHHLNGDTKRIHEIFEMYKKHVSGDEFVSLVTNVGETIESKED